MTLTTPTTAEASTPGWAQLPTDERLRVAPDNPRRDLGDLEELIDSVKAHGILEPLLVTPREDYYLLVCGARRLAAARFLELRTVPAVIRELTEPERVAAMIIENVQRSDLTPLEEASAYARLLEVDPDATQRDLAKLTGVSQRTVSARLALLELPIEALEALDTSRITLANAEQLHKLVDAGLADRAAELAVQQAHGKLPAWQPLEQAVKEDLDRLALERKAEQTRADLKAQGITLLQEPKGGWYNRVPRPLAGDDHQGCLYVHPLVQVPLQEHAARACHAAAVCPHGERVWMCRDPKLHADQDPRAAADADYHAKREREADYQAKREREEAERRQHDRALTVAARIRVERCRALLAPEVLATYQPIQQVDDVLCTLLARLEANVAKAACKLLELDPVEEAQSYGGTYKNYRRALEQLAEDPAIRGRVARAVVLAHAEEHLRVGWGRWIGRVADRHLATLQAAGHELSEAEQAKLEADRAEASAEPAGPGGPDGEELRICRCGDEADDHDLDEDLEGRCTFDDCECPAYRPDAEDLEPAAEAAAGDVDAAAVP
jgi:ParB/RepB/Spo0J family partition protein